MPTNIEDVISEIPFTLRRKIKWGESDPAGIVYTPRFHDYLMEAIDAWLETVIGIDWFRLNTEMGLGSPMVHTSIDYHSPVRPGDILDVKVTLDHIGSSAYTLEIGGYKADGTHVFQGKAVSVVISRETWKSHPMPDEYRERMEAYMHACKG